MGCCDGPNGCSASGANSNRPTTPAPAPTPLSRITRRASSPPRSSSMNLSPNNSSRQMNGTKLARFAASSNSNHSVGSGSRSTPLAEAANGTSHVLAMLPAGKSCCAENACGPEGASGAASNYNMNETSNVLVQYTLQDLDRRAESNFWLGLICLLVCAINCVLIFLNLVKHLEAEHPKVSHRTFHLIEFWTSCVYSIAETFALVMSPKTMHHIYNKPNLLKLLLFFNVVNSTIPAILMTLDFHYFEKISHELEFINSFTLSFITMVLLASLLNPPSLDDNTNLPGNLPAVEGDDDDKLSIIMGVIACIVAATNFIVYNLGYHTAAHYLEFSFNILISLITFWFCMDNRFMAQMEIGQILYGKHQNCIFCQIRSGDAEQLRETTKYQNMFGGEGEISIPVMRGALTCDEDTIKRRSKGRGLSKRGSRGSATTNDDEDEYDEEMQASESTPLIHGGGSRSTKALTANGSVISIASEDHFQTMLKQNSMVVVMFCAEWCKTSLDAKPKFLSLAQQYPVACCSVDVDDFDEIAFEYNVVSTPTFLIFQNGKLHGTTTGTCQLDNFVDRALNQ